jgi:hypothetical protein
MSDATPDREAPKPSQAVMDRRRAADPLLFESWSAA